MQYSDTNDNEDGMKEIGEWANLAKDLYSVFNDQSDQQDVDSPDDNEEGMKKIDQWAKLVKDLYPPFNDQSDQQDADSPVQVNQYNFRFIGF